jgi:C-1 hydroxylase
MTTEQNKAIVRRFVEAINAQDYGTLDEVNSPKLAEEMKGLVPWIYATFGPSHHIMITDIIAEDDKVVARLATRGSHTGEWHGIPPTYKAWTNTGVYFLRLADNKIIESDFLFDELGHVKKLGGTIASPS